MLKYKVITADGEVEIEATGVYMGGLSGKDLTFFRKGEWVEPAAMPIPRRADPLGYIPPAGYNTTEYIAGFNGDYWRSYMLISTVAEAA